MLADTYSSPLCSAAAIIDIIHSRPWYCITKSRHFYRINAGRNNYRFKSPALSECASANFCYSVCYINRFDISAALKSRSADARYSAAYNYFLDIIRTIVIHPCICTLTRSRHCQDSVGKHIADSACLCIVGVFLAAACACSAWIAMPKGIDIAVFVAVSTWAGVHGIALSCACRLHNLACIVMSMSRSKAYNRRPVFFPVRDSIKLEFIVLSGFEIYSKLSRDIIPYIHICSIVIDIFVF